MQEELNILSLGAGVQSSTMLLMSCMGILPKPDYAIFADTMWEPPSVYRYLHYLEGFSKQAGIPILTCSRGDIRKAFLNEADIRATPPLFVRTGDKVSLLRRQCTLDYKIVPIRRLVRTLQVSKKQPVNMWLGITVDEIMRAKSSVVKWVKHTFPLLERRMSRINCLEFMRDHGYQQPPKSACVGCPFRSDAGWEKLKTEEPETWATAIRMDHAIREGCWTGTLKGIPYLHRSGVPLSEVTLRPKEKDRDDLWTNECEGMCGM